MGIGLIFYGEDGEVEYGGTTETDKNPIYDVHYMRKVYLEGGYEKVLQNSGLPEKDLFFTASQATRIDAIPYRNYTLVLF